MTIAAAATLWLAIQALDLGDVRQAADEVGLPGAELLDSLARYPVRAAAVGLAIALAAQGWALLATSRRRALATVLRRLQAVAYGAPGGSLDPVIRISLWVSSYRPARGHLLVGLGRLVRLRPCSLRCLVRTGGHRTRRRWPLGAVDAPPVGLVADRYLRGGSASVPGIATPFDDADQVAVEAYLGAARVTRAIAGSLSWPGAALLVVAVEEPGQRRPLAVVVVESREPDAALLRSDVVGATAELCRILLTGEV